jgi:hypothetical protein
MNLQRLGIIGCGGIAELVLATLMLELPSPLRQQPMNLAVTTRSVRTRAWSTQRN